MQEPLLLRVRNLESSVRRWKLISLALFILLISGTVISGTFGVILLLDGHSRHAAIMEAEMRAREQAEIARHEVERARMEAQIEQQRLNLRRKQAEDEKGELNP